MVSRIIRRHSPLSTPYGAQIKEKSMSVNEINWPYTVGLLDTDGSFYVIFKKDARMPIKYRIHPEIEWSQKKRQLLEKVQEYHSIHKKAKRVE